MPPPISEPIRAPVPLPDRRIDVHCHVFNVLDVPAYAFVMDVVIENPLLRVLGAPFVALFVSTAEFRAHGFADEQRVLTAHRGTPSALAKIAKNSDTPEDQFVGGFRSYIDRYTKYSTAGGGMPAQADTAQYDDFVDKELFLRFLPNIIDYSKVKTFVDIGTQMQAVSPKLASAINGYSGPDETALYIRQFLTDWAPKLSDYRFQLAELTEGFDEAGANVPLMLTPAMVDLTHWLPSADLANPPTALADQAELMRLIALVQPTGRLVHGFIAYDPLTQIYDEAAHRRTALEVVQDAIATKGFIGVKLYPPMGFRAIGNSEIPDRQFPRELTRQFPGLGVLLDRSLEKLYAYCVSEGVPIMAHCAATQGSSPEAANRADPAFWANLLDTAAYKTLHVNLGHLGGVWDLDLRGAWGATILEMMTSGRYPTLYADFADFTDVLGRTSEQVAKRALVLQSLTGLVGKNPDAKSHLLYGSDWHLLDREPGNAAYPTAMATWMAQGFQRADLPDLFWRNSARYMGLVHGGKTLARLQKFYRDNRADPAVLDPFIV